ncbi:putative MFS-type transporter YusP [Smittium culicis]|uniref:Putative MFS-type transporter YusP n=2 Tax=Smittium culicis TaxID=133412 RepID=A0A1R1XIR1_9FUNG|nr:putative MFS-type transporter YusP [Smittium culicis]
MDPRNDSIVSSITYRDENSETGQTLGINPDRLVLIVAGLCVLIFSATLSGTIVSTATESIKLSLGEDNITWVAQAFLISSTALQPAWGKFSDIFGRRPPMLMGIVLLLIFSIVAGLSINMIMLIISRAIMGIGASSSLAMVNIIIADIIPIRKRGKYMGVISAFNGVGQVIGPLMGGIISDKLGWRWTNFINVPLVLVAAVPLYIYVRMPNPKMSLRKKFVSVDWKGVFILAIAISLLLYGVNTGGENNVWNQPQSFGYILAGVLLFILFPFVELKTKRDPIISMTLIKYRNVWINILGATITGTVMYVGIFYIPVLFTAVHNSSATEAGLLTWPWMVSVIIASVSCGAAITKFGIYRPFLWVGSSLLAIGFGLMCSLTSTDSFTKQAIYIAIVGVGIGLRLPPATISAQVVVSKDELASTTALINFSRSLGGILGLSMSKAIQSSTFNSNKADLISQFPSLADTIDKISKGNAQAIYSISDPNAQKIILDSFFRSLKIVFMICCGISVLGFIFSLFILHVDLNQKEKQEIDEQDLINSQQADAVKSVD